MYMLKDGQLQSFVRLWNFYLQGMRKRPDDNKLRIIFWDKLKHTTEIPNVLQKYNDGLDDPRKKKPYSWLWNKVYM